MELTIVTTIYNSKLYIEEFFHRITKSALSITSSYELIFVNDGSQDSSLEIVKKLHLLDPKIKIIDLSRNYGHHQAMMAGLRHARGEYVFLIDVDLEEEPENLAKFWEVMKQDVSIDVVYGLQEKRQTPFFKRFSGGLFYSIFNALSSTKIEDGELVSRLMKRKFVDSLISYQEKELFIPGVWSHAGFNKVSCKSNKGFNGNSNYSVKKLMSMAFNAIISFSSKPLEIIFYLGSLILFFSLIFIVYLVLQKIVNGTAINGWTSILASVYLLGGISIFSTGIVGIYLAKIFNEIKQRPNSIIKTIISNDGAPEFRPIFKPTVSNIKGKNEY
ncbi:MAG: putative glycosyltransferase [Chlamydiae bacterium]|nr:putative glycosyltransferase [Chlamydiota bacterium]